MGMPGRGIVAPGVTAAGISARRIAAALVLAAGIFDLRQRVRRENAKISQEILWT